jgi:hypothetical protein
LAGDLSGTNHDILEGAIHAVAEQAAEVDI